MSRTIPIGLVQINNSFSGQNYLPLSIAMLEGYVKDNAQHPERYNFLMPIYKRIGISDAVDQLISADIVGFSTYVWNGRISLEIARRLKAQRPDIFIVFGGPHVPDESEEFLRENKCVDVVVHNEGEATFLEIIENYPDHDWEAINGVAFIKDGQHCKTPNRARMKDLDMIVSPFLSGMFDRLMDNNPTERWIGLWETNRGCPFKCTFCDWGSATAAKVNKFDMERLKAEVDWFAESKIEYVFCCDANFGILPRDVDIARYVAQVKQQYGYPSALSVQNTKNATERAYLTQKILSDAGLNKGVVLSMQSTDEQTLTSIKRENISLDTYFELQNRFTNDRVETYSDLILALPGETYESFIEGVNQLIESGQHNRIQFNNLSILPNAEMGNKAYQKQYGMEMVESKIINIHGERIELEDDVDEYQELVIATSAMPRDQWRKTRAFCWMSALLYFDKLLQIPLSVMHQLTNMPYKTIFEKFMDAPKDKYPTIASISQFFFDTAQDIQDGKPEYVFSQEWLGMYWPADEYVFIDLTVNGQLSDFFDEASILLSEGLADEVDREILADAITLNRSLIKQPFQDEDILVECSYNVLEYYNAVRIGTVIGFQRETTTIHIDCVSESYDDLQDWCREVVWWGNKKGAYLYGNKAVGKQYAGHF